MTAVRVVNPDTAAVVVAVAGRVLAALDDVVPMMGAAYREVPEYNALSDGEMEASVLPVSRRIAEGFFLPVTDGRDPDPSDLPELPVMARRRLEMGIPLEPMLHVYRIAGRVVWDAVAAATEPGEEHALPELGRRWMDYIDRAATIAAAEYMAASHSRLRAVDARRRALVDALLAAADPAEVAAVSIRFATALAPAYVPVVVDGERAATHIDAMLGAAPDGTIGGPRGSRVLLLVPHAFDDVNPVWRASERALLGWGIPAVPGPELLAEVGHVEALLAAAAARGHHHGAFGPDDLLLDQLLVDNERVAQALHRRVHGALAGRDHDGLLTSTLARYLDCGSVPETAKTEHVHANTVLYRLNRVKALCGLDPRVPADAALLVLAFRPRPGEVR